MKRGFLAACSLAAGLALTGCIGGDFGLPFRASVDETRPLPANGELSLENVNGTVELAAWDEAKVRIEAVKHAASERALEELKVEIVGEGDHLSVRTRYPRPRWMGGAGKVDYRVSVPRGARVRVSNVNGRVRVNGVGGEVKASTVNGSVDVTGAGGGVEASAVNGSVEVAMARVDPAGRSQLSTTNGSVRLTLPREASADVRCPHGERQRRLRLRARRRDQEPPEARGTHRRRRRPLRARHRQRLGPHRSRAVGDGLPTRGRGDPGARQPLSSRMPGPSGPVGYRRTAGADRRVTERPAPPSRKLLQERG